MSLIITKKIAKQGENLILIIPKNLHDFVKQGDIVKVELKVLNQEDKDE